MATTGQQIADKAWQRLSDTGVRWPIAEVLAAINDGQVEIVTLAPQANPKTTKAVMSTSDTRQTLAGMSITDGLQIMRVLRNWDAAGTTVGSAITKVPMATLDTYDPAWHSTTAAEVAHYDTDPLDPTAVYIYPKVSANKRIEVVYSGVPAALASLANNISLPDTYANPLLLYVLYALLSKRVQGSVAMRAEAAGYYQQMAQALGLRTQVLSGVDQAATQKGAVA